MRYHMLTAILLAGALLAAGGAGADDQLTVREQRLPDRVFAEWRQDIDVDGDLSEWRFREGAVEINAETAKLDPGPVASLEDSSAVVKFAWDGEFLYLAAQVKDQSLVPLPDPKGMPWACDSLILVLSTYGATKDSPRYQQAKTAETSTEPFFGFSYYGRDTGPRQWTRNSHYVARATRHGYVIEAAISLADIGYEPKPGDRIKMAFILSDHDEDGKFSQLTLGWPNRLAITPVNSWLDLRFQGPEGWAGSFVAAQDRLVANAAALQFQGDLDGFREGVTLTGVVLQNEAGERVAGVPAQAPLRPGVTTMVEGTVSTEGLPPGSYRIAAAVEEGGQAQTGGAPALFEIVLTEESERGIAGRFPNRYIVPDPRRGAFPSTRWGYEQRTVTRQDYIDLVRRVYDFEYASIFSRGREADAGHHGFAYAMTAYALWKHTGDRTYLEPALGLVRGACEAFKQGQTTPFWIENREILNMMLADPGIAEADKEWLRPAFRDMVQAVWSQARPTEWGAFNRALLWGGLLDMAAAEWPDHPDVEKWREYAELQWSSWWPYRDHDENADAYNASSMLDYLHWAEFRNPEYLRDEGLIKWQERQMYQVTPSGGFPGYGDSSPWNGSAYMWIPVFERMAALTGDGRFKWAAHRLFEYADRQMDDFFSYHMVYDGAAKSCAWAYLYADETVAPTPPEMRSRMLERKQILPVEDELRKEMLEKHGITGLYYRLEDEWQPDKLILRAGNDPFAPAGMIELCSNAGHHMSTVPNFNSFMDMRTVLLTDLGYFEKGPEYHNVIFIEDLTGIAAEVPDEVVTVPELEVGGRATYASIQVEHYKNWPVTNDRRVLFTHRGLVVVKDLLHFEQPFVCRVRQQWQTRDISPQSGDNWVNVNIPFLLNTGLGLGRGVQTWNNPNWDLLIYFTPQQGRDYEVFDRSLENQWQAVPLRVSQRWRGLPEVGEPLHFTTLLWPHTPVPDVAEYADRVTVLEDTPEVTAFQVGWAEDAGVYLGINDSGGRIQVGEVETDARVFLCEYRPAEKQPFYLYLVDATYFALGGVIHHASAERATVDKNL